MTRHGDSDVIWQHVWMNVVSHLCIVSKHNFASGDLAQPEQKKNHFMPCSKHNIVVVGYQPDVG